MGEIKTTTFQLEIAKFKKQKYNYKNIIIKMKK